MKCPNATKTWIKEISRTYSFAESSKGIMLMCAKNANTFLVSVQTPDQVKYTRKRESFSYAS